MPPDPHRTWRHLDDCYGCGPENHSGLHLELEATAAGARATGRFGRAFNGAPGLVHGGVLVTMLDEVMGAVPGATGRARVTKTLQVRFRRPVETERVVVATADVVARDERGFRVRAELRYQDDDVVRAEAAAEFVHVDLPAR